MFHRCVGVAYGFVLWPIIGLYPWVYKVIAIGWFLNLWPASGITGSTVCNWRTHFDIASSSVRDWWTWPVCCQAMHASSAFSNDGYLCLLINFPVIGRMTTSEKAWSQFFPSMYSSPSCCWRESYSIGRIGFSSLEELIRIENRLFRLVQISAHFYWAEVLIVQVLRQHQFCQRCIERRFVVLWIHGSRRTLGEPWRLWPGVAQFSSFDQFMGTSKYKWLASLRFA